MRAILFIQYTLSLSFHSIVNLSNTADSQPTLPPIILSVLLVKYILCKCYVFTLCVCLVALVCVYMQLLSVYPAYILPIALSLDMRFTRIGLNTVT